MTGSLPYPPPRYDRGSLFISCLLVALALLPLCVYSTETSSTAPPLSINSSNQPAPGPSLTNALIQGPGTASAPNGLSQAEWQAKLEGQLEAARQTRRGGQPREAEPALIDLLAAGNPQSIQQQALLELAETAYDAGDLPRTQQIYAQFTARWRDATMIPEVLLRQGRVFREMGLNNLALAKFYAVMTSSLVLRKDTFGYYQRIVLLAQTEIAETHYQLGKFTDAVDFLSRLLKQNAPGLNRAAAQFKLVRALSALKQHGQTLSQGLDFLSHFPEASERPEVRFHVALALKQLGRNPEALQQVFTLLQEEKSGEPGSWTYWQQRAGNEIGNQLYRDGDYTRALQIYLAVTPLDPRAEWQLPVLYQLGLVYERLQQPEKARETYDQIVARQPELGSHPSAGLQAIVEMARWRAGLVKWQAEAENKLRRRSPPVTALASTASGKTEAIQ